MSLVLRVAARYKKKKVLDTGTVVYQYSDRQVSRRNNDKANRIEGLKKSISKLRSKVKSDLTSKDTKTRLTALVVALIDHTYERVGNEESAKEGHFGVTGWQKKHVTLGKDSANIEYVGKSGVKHDKKVIDPIILKALRQAYEGASEKTSCLFEFDEGCVRPSDVNEYLSPFKVTAKDLRGFHANREMQTRLRKVRAETKLPEDKSKREKLLKKEFDKALKETAEAVGHEPSTLRSQYLVPNLEETYLKDGTVLGKLNDKSAMCGPPPPLVFSHRVIRMLVDHSGLTLHIRPDDYALMCTLFNRCKGSWEMLYQGDPSQHVLLSAVVNSWVATKKKAANA